MRLITRDGSGLGRRLGLGQKVGGSCPSKEFHVTEYTLGRILEKVGGGSAKAGLHGGGSLQREPGTSPRHIGGGEGLRLDGSQ